MLFRFLIYVPLMFISCVGENELKGTISSTIEKSTLLDPTKEIRFELIDYPKDFLEENGLQDWDEFKRLYDAMDRLKELDLRDVEVNIIGISGLLNELVSDNLPDQFEIPQIRSRLKVVQMQAQKSRYFTRHYKKDSLIPSIKFLYNYYNSIISRMITIKQEETAVVTSTKK